jgi:hypothetical protein
MDNLRYISLQYIKGDNYEKIQCFKYEEMIELLKEIQESRDYSRPMLDKLEAAVEEEKCPIGESFLNDLVNYYNFKDIKERLGEVKKDIEYAGYDSKNGDNRTELIKSLKELITGVGGISQSPDIGREILKKNPEPVNAKLGFAKNILKTDVYSPFKESASKCDLIFEDIPQNGATDTEAEYKKEIEEDFADFIVLYDYTDTEGLKTRLKDEINYVLIQQQGTKEHLIMLLETLKTVLLYEDSLDTIMALFNRYIKMCVRNIGKYEDLFSKNDISNIDDVFMIKSYATFLHKLETLKKNLESKDQTKLERELTHALEKLFDLYGINDPDAIIADEKNYIYDHIANTDPL